MHGRRVVEFSGNNMKGHFPHLDSSNHKVTSVRTVEYNCIAWAAGESDRWWDVADGYYWPPGATKGYHTEALIEAFNGLGYAETQNPAYEEGVEKVAIYSLRGEFTHAARQLKDGRWASKLGELEDIEHKTLEALEGPFYGKPTVILKRKAA